MRGICHHAHPVLLLLILKKEPLTCSPYRFSHVVIFVLERCNKVAKLLLANDEENGCYFQLQVGSNRSPPPRPAALEVFLLG